jgi:hypothetical protein
VSCSSFYIGCTLWRRRPQAQPGRMPCLATLMGDLHGAHWEWEVRSPRSGLKMGRVPSFGSMRPPSPTGSQSSSVTARTVILRLNTRWQQCFVPCLSPQADAELAIVRGIAEVSSSRRGIFFCLGTGKLDTSGVYKMLKSQGCVRDEDLDMIWNQTLACHTSTTPVDIP